MSELVNQFEDVRAIKGNKKCVYNCDSEEVLKTLTFNSGTKWANPDVAQKILERGKIPPLDIKKLHKLGITGKGVNVAIIDQPLALHHPEYSKNINIIFPQNYDIPISSMHGPAVTSLLCGKSCGVAPDANIYYCAVPMWLGDAQYEAKALNWILKLNKELDDDKKIKFVSVSAAPGDKAMRPKNWEKWIKTIKKVQEAGICVVECTEGNRFTSVGYVDLSDNSFKYGFPNRSMKNAQLNQVHVPNSMRTLAESSDDKHFSYMYSGVGGLSWGIPYAVGTLCLAEQVNPELSAFELKDLLIESARKNNGIINPIDFVKTVKNEKSLEKGI